MKKSTIISGTTQYIPKRVSVKYAFKYIDIISKIEKCIPNIIMTVHSVFKN